MEQTGIPQKKKNIGVIVGVATFLVVSVVVQQLFFKPATFDKAMMEAASELNKSCPLMVDQDTRLDNAAAMPGNVFQYNYTLVNYDQSEIVPDTLKKYLEPGIINTIRTNPDMKIYRDNNVTIAYQYKDKNGVFLLKILVKPDQYK